MKRKALFSVILSIITMFLLTATGFASVGQKEVKLNYNNIKIFLDNEIVCPADESGKYVEPFIIDGTTYLPVRSVAAAMDLSVNWDGSTKTISLTSGAEAGKSVSVVIPKTEARSVLALASYNNIRITLDGATITPKDANGNSVEPFIIDGTTYLPVRGIASALGLSVSWDGTNKTVLLSSKDGTSDTNVSVPETGWVKVDGATASFLIKGALEGKVVYRNGAYWAEKNYVDSYTNENIVSIVDISGGGRTPEQEFVDHVNSNTVVTEAEKWIKPSELSYVVTQIGIQKIMQGQLATSSVSEIEILQYCMPSIPSNFVESPKSGEYDGIRVKVENGEILLNQSDLENKGFIN